MSDKNCQGVTKNVTDEKVSKRGRPHTPKIDINKAIKFRLLHHMSQPQIADYFKVSIQAVNQALEPYQNIFLEKQQVDKLEELFPRMLTGTKFNHIIDMNDPIKREEASLNNTAYSFDKINQALRGQPSPQINIIIAGQILQQAQADQISLKQAIFQITGKDPDQLMQDITSPLPVVSNTILDGSIISDNPVLCSDNKDIPK